MGRMFRLLKADEIEVKVKQVKEKGAVALIYKTSRVDMDILDETLGAMNWTTEYGEIKGNLYCGIGIRHNITDPFVWKWDCGIESRGDDEGNEKKGEASDAFKRAGFKVGIGRELYSAPWIFLNVETELDGRKYKLKNPFDSFSVQAIEYDANDKISALTIVNSKGQVVYKYPKSSASTITPAPKAQPLQNSPKTAPKTNESKKVGEILTVSEMVAVWGVENPDKTIAWLENKFDLDMDDWTIEHHQQARAFLKAGKEKRDAAKRSAMIEQMAAAEGDLPFKD